MKRLRDRLKARLALRIYLVGLAQFAVVAAGFWALLTLTRRPGGGPVEATLRYIGQNLSAAVGTPGRLEAEVGRISPEVCAPLTVIDPDGAVVASSSPARARCQAPGKTEDGSAYCVQQPMDFPGGRRGQVECTFLLKPPITGMQIILAVLSVVGVSSVLLSRSLTGPLRRLSSAAQALGGGDLGARVELRRSDELGEVAHAFDEMAGRVASLLRAEKELLANISHELRTPLARIRVALDLAIEGDAEVARESFVDIAGDLDELERLISDVLTAARLDLGDGTAPAGLPPLRRQRIAPGDLLGQSAARLRTAHPGRPLRVEAPADLPSIDGDPVLLRRALDNLLENAHRYSDRPEAPVSLVARPEGEGLHIEVVDQGIGIAPDDLARVFRPFFRADRSRARATGGLGLGLALTRRIIEAHGGRIELQSAIDQGTRACLWLPAAR